MKNLNKENNTNIQTLSPPTAPKQDPRTKVSFDLSYLEKVSRNNLLFIKEMISIFLKEIPSAMEKIELELKDQNWTQVANLAHRRKTNYMMMGMTSQEKNALFIERSIKENRYTPKVIIKQVNQLMADSKQAYPILEAELCRRNKET